MPMGSGYFVDLNNYEVIPINDHYQDVKAHPEKYRMKADDITEDRGETLQKVLKKGFGRVRHHQSGSPDFSFEAYGRDDDVYAGLLAYAKLKDLPSSTYVKVFNLRNKKSEEAMLRTIVDRMIGDVRNASKDWDARLTLAIRRLAKRIDMSSRKASKTQDFASKLLLSFMKVGSE